MESLRTLQAELEEDQACLQQELQDVEEKYMQKPQLCGFRKQEMLKKHLERIEPMLIFSKALLELEYKIDKFLSTRNPDGDVQEYKQTRPIYHVNATKNQEANEMT